MPLKYKGEAVVSDHSGWPWESDGPSIPLFFLFVFFLFAMIASDFAKKCLRKCNLASEIEDVEVDE